MIIFCCSIHQYNIMSAIKRLQREYMAIQKEPLENILIKPSVDNILEWYFVIHGSPSTPYEGGYYAGKIVFPPEYPMRAPDFIMLSDNGRFEVGKKICLSFSGYHQETWNPIWTISSMMRGLVSFMYTEDVTVGAIKTSDEEKKAIAKDSKRRVLEISKIATLFAEELGS